MEERIGIITFRQGIIRYIQMVKELTREPDYGEVLQAVKKLLGKEADDV